MHQHSNSPPISLKKRISIIGGGSAALAFAAHINTEKFDVVIYEKNKALGRKFLVAGAGGFNLTHGSNILDMVKQYEPQDFLEQALLQFSNEDFRQWLKVIGIETYVGSSNRVFPIKSIKPIEVLQAILKNLKHKGIQIQTGKQWTGWNPDNFIQLNGSEHIESDIVVYALGGGSWKVSGSDGSWLSFFKDKNIPNLDFKAANCAFEIQWPSDFISHHAGKALKNITLSSSRKTYKGELSITTLGLEGNAIYPLSSDIQSDLAAYGKAQVSIDFKPMFTEKDLLNKLEKSKAKSINDKLKTDLVLSNTAIQLIKNHLDKDSYANYEVLAKTIKQLPLTLIASAPIDEAISTTGGIDLEAIDENFQLKALPNHYCLGEMLDWNAPTGGYLLQACFSMGVKLARHLNDQVS